MKTCAFTGHRPQHLPFGMNENDERCVKLKEELKEQIINLIEAENVTHFITGMALGVDLYAAEIVLGLKARYPSITLESAIPRETQAVKWSMAQRERYYDIAAQCDKETMLQSHYSPDCMDKRNRYMVDHAAFIIAVWDGRSSGTGKTVQYAQRQGKPVTIINPKTMRKSLKRAFWLHLRLFLLLSREVVQNSLDDSIGIINIKCLDNIDDTL